MTPFEELTLELAVKRLARGVFASDYVNWAIQGLLLDHQGKNLQILAGLDENIHLFDSLTKREKELLKFFALGNSNESISKELFISVETVATHRKNIKRKLGCKSNYDCTHFAQVFNII